MPDATSVIRDEWPRVVAALVAGFGDLGDAEDATQDAAEQALRQWPSEGVPDRPGAWLLVVARRRLIDRRRRHGVRHEKATAATGGRETLMPAADDDFDELYAESLMRDEQLRLVFACCHRALSREAQVALTLRSVGGLTTREIAAALLEPEATVAQRLVRAKRKIKAAAIPFRIPPDAELLTRSDQVRSVLYRPAGTCWPTAATRPRPPRPIAGRSTTPAMTSSAASSPNASPPWSSIADR